MSGGLVQVERVQYLTALTGGTAYTNPTGTVKVALSTATTSDTSAGTEVSGGSYARQAYGAGTPTSANPSVVSNSSTINFTGMPAVTTTDINIYDSTGTPVRKAWGPLSASKATGSGDTLQFPASTGVQIQL